MAEVVPSRYVHYDPECVPPAFGLSNTGAICWLNSLIQALLGVSSLNKTLLDHESEFSSNRFAREYIRLVKMSLGREPAAPGAIAGSSAAILGALIGRAREVGVSANLGMGQECADEAFTLFIELFAHPLVEELFANVYELRIACTGCSKIVSKNRDNAFRIQLFTRIDLNTQDLFIRYIRAHPSQCDYFKCDDCGTIMRDFPREERLRRLGEVIVIVFNKFQQKTNRWFPPTLEFGSPDGSTLRYRLISKIDHSGTMHSGHYIANSLRATAAATPGGGVPNLGADRALQWSRLNDSSVSVGDGAPSPSTFMVIYHMVQD
jgi:uncharacterized UBP type Zn finger protein